MFVSLLRADDKGQYLPTVSVEIMFFNIHSVGPDGTTIDITHMDRSIERLRITGEYVMNVGEAVNVYQISIVPYPTSGEILSKDDWQARIVPWKVANQGEMIMRDFQA